VPTRGESNQEAKKAAASYDPKVTYILEYHKGKGEPHKEAFTRKESKENKRARLEASGYTIDRDYERRSA